MNELNAFLDYQKTVVYKCIAAYERTAAIEKDEGNSGLLADTLKELEWFKGQQWMLEKVTEFVEARNVATN